MQFANNPAQQSLHQCEQIAQQLIQQTQQASQNYQHLLQQEQQNAQRLEELAHREQKAAQMIQTALQGHQTAIQQLHQISQICRQLENTLQNQSYVPQQNQQQPYSNTSLTQQQPMSFNNNAGYRSMQ